MAESDRIARVATSRHSRGRVAALAIACVLLVVACSSGDSTSESSTTAVNRSSTSTTTTALTTTEEPSTPSTSTPSGQSVEEEIVARYIGYWDARLAANSGTANPSDPALREYAVGAQLEVVIAETQSNLDEGLSFQERPDPADLRTVDVIEVDGDRAVVQECFVDDGLVVRSDTGEIVNDTVATHNVRGELRRVDGAWRVSEVRLIQRWEGVAGCANVG